MSAETRTSYCLDCPIKPGRICVSIKQGNARLVFDPTNSSTGPRLREPYQIDESIFQCINKINNKALNFSL